MQISNSHPVYTRSTSFTHSEERMKMISNSFSLGFHVKNFTYLCFLFVFCHHGTHGYFISIKSNLLMTMTNVYLLCNIHFLLYNSSSMMNSWLALKVFLVYSFANKLILALVWLSDDLPFQIYIITENMGHLVFDIHTGSVQDLWMLNIC